MAHNLVLDDFTPVGRPRKVSIGNTFTPGADDDNVFPEPAETSPCPVQWDVFESHELGSKSCNDSSSLQLLQLFLKLCFAFTLCVLVLLLGLLNKFTLLKTYAQMNTTIYNNACSSSLHGSLTETIPNQVTGVTNLWALLLCLCLPYFLALVPLIRRVIFKNTRAIETPTLLKVLILETLHSIGLFMLTYFVLPKLGIVHAILVLEGIGLFPIILKVTEHKYQKKLSTLSRISDWFVLLCQISFFLYWLLGRPILERHWQSLNLILPVSVLLISLQWWDNYVGLRPGSRLCRALLKLKKTLQRTRTRTYLVINLWKVCVNLVLFVLVIGNWRLDCYRALFYVQTSADACLAGQMSLSVSGEHLEPLINALVNVSATFLCYQCVKIACRVLCQIPCFVLPLSLLPFLSIVLFPAVNLEEFQWTNISESFQWRSPASWKEYMLCSVLQEHLPIGILWIISVLLLAGQIFNTGTERLASIEKLFVKPIYCDILMEKFWFLNRRRNDSQYKSTEKRLVSYSKRSRPSLESHSVSNLAFGGDKRPMVFICATVWHETEKEMCEMLKSIFRLDIDQSARRHTREYFHVKDTDYYAFEAHVVVDDAFDPDGSVNNFVKQLVRVMDSAVSGVHNVILHMKPPTKYPTPYGGRLEWTLPGGNLLMVHLKNKKMIRTKKRWSQVMYMYWILGYRLMSIEGPSQLKHTIAENTYLLTLDGDVEFKPSALLKLLDRMKKNPHVGAACGRIHPVGSGPLVWYQKFEYAISHWLQKSAEHVIGCVLCSPGCFSLFRGSALMDDNVLSTYTGVSSKSIDYLQRDQGEDRWLCTLLLQRGYRVEYCAASDAMTFAPEKFSEFFNQRRRWIPSTLANTMEILSNWKIFIRNNDNISFFYLAYQALLMVISFVSPGTIFLLIVGAINKAYPSITLSTSLFLNFLPLLIMMILCKYASTEKQLNFACILAMIYVVVMMAVLAGLCLEIAESFCSTTSVFATLVFGAFGLAALLHPQEFPAVFGVVLYLLAVPCMSVILIIYAMGNLHIVSWGTREIVQQPPELIPQQQEEEGETTEDQNQTATAPTFGVSFLGKSPQRNTVLEHFRRMVNGLRKAVHKEKCSDGHDQILQRIQEMDYKISKVLRQQRNDRMSLSSVPCTPIFLRFNNDNAPQQREPPRRVEPVAWHNDKGLGDGRLSEISMHESKFWKDFIRKYLLPLQSKPDDQLQIKASLEKLRNRIAIVYILSNLCFITLILSLEYSSVSNERLSFDMPCYVSGVHLARIRPLSIVFAMVFGVLLICQLVAMLFHRVSTFLHIISSIDLRFRLPFNRVVQLNNLQLAKDMQSLDKDVVDPESVFVSTTDYEEDYESEEGDDDVFQTGRTGNCRDILNRKRQPVWLDRVDKRCREPGSLRGRFHENFKNITGRRYNKSESEQLVREREMAGFHVNSLPALAIMVNNSELVRQRWERATRRIIAQCRSRKRQQQPKLVGTVNSFYASPALLEFKRDINQEPPETPIVIETQEDQRSTRFVFIPHDTFDTPL